MLTCNEFSNNILQVTFDKQVLKRSVSLSGDVFDPSGTLTGGSRSHTSSILTQLSELCERESALRKQEAALRDLDIQLANMHTQARE